VGHSTLLAGLIQENHKTAREGSVVLRTEYLNPPTHTLALLYSDTQRVYPSNV
jgi:hypothetical protein